MLITSSFSAGTHTSVGHTWEVKQRWRNTKWAYLAEGEGSMQVMVVEADEDRLMMRETEKPRRYCGHVWVKIHKPTEKNWNNKKQKLL